MGFQQPPIKTFKPPPTVSLGKTDADRQELYAELTADREKELAAEGKLLDLEQPAAAVADPPEGLQAPLPGAEAPEPDPEVSEDDRRAFRRSIFGRKPYVKRYELFGGGMTVELQDRMVPQTEEMYRRLNADAAAKRIDAATEADWAVWAERYHLAAVLRQVKDPVQTADWTLPEDHLARVKELTALPRPLYSALIDTARRFDREVAFMIRKAADRDFWPADGTSSR